MPVNIYLVVSIDDVIGCWSSGG